MKNKEESLIGSRRGGDTPYSERIRPRSRPPLPSGQAQGQPVAASITQPALSHFPECLMEAVVEPDNMTQAWKNVRANRGAPGPDGITLAEFEDYLRPRWPDIRQQLLTGTYQPSPVRRVEIDKPDGGTRQLGIPNVLDRVIQQAIIRSGVFGIESRLPTQPLGSRSRQAGTTHDSPASVRGGHGPFEVLRSRLPRRPDEPCVPQSARRQVTSADRTLPASRRNGQWNLSTND